MDFVLEGLRASLKDIAVITVVGFGITAYLRRKEHYHPMNVHWRTTSVRIRNNLAKAGRSVRSYFREKRELKEIKRHQRRERLLVKHLI